MLPLLVSTFPHSLRENNFFHPDCHCCAFNGFFITSRQFTLFALFGTTVSVTFHHSTRIHQIVHNFAILRHQLDLEVALAIIFHIIFRQFSPIIGVEYILIVIMKKSIHIELDAVAITRTVASAKNERITTRIQLNGKNRLTCFCCVRYVDRILGLYHILISQSH